MYLRDIYPHMLRWESMKMQWEAKSMVISMTNKVEYWDISDNVKYYKQG